MTTIYNCHHDGDQYRITKFIDGTPEGSYLTTLSECECPAGSRDTCRHRQMLPTFLGHDLVNTPWFIDWDHRSWPCDFEGKVITPAPVEQTVVEDTPRSHSPMVTTADFDSADDGSIPSVTATSLSPAQPWRRI